MILFLTAKLVRPSDDHTSPLRLEALPYSSAARGQPEWIMSGESRESRESASHQGGQTSRVSNAAS